MPRGEKERFVGEYVGAKSCPHSVLGSTAEPGESLAVKRAAAAAIGPAAATGTGLGVIEMINSGGHVFRA